MLRPVAVGQVLLWSWGASLLCLCVGALAFPFCFAFPVFPSVTSVAPSPCSPPPETVASCNSPLSRMFAALPSPWQKAAKQWHAQQGTGQRYLSPTQRCLDCTASEGAVRAAVGCLGWGGVALASARRQEGQQADWVPEEGRRPLYPLTVRLATALQLRREGFFW